MRVPVADAAQQSVPRRARRVALASLVLAVMAVAVAIDASPAAARGCGNLTVGSPRGYGWSGFSVRNMTCRHAAQVMRAFARSTPHRRGRSPNFNWGVVAHFRITSRGYLYRGARGRQRFSCYLYGTD